MVTTTQDTLPEVPRQVVQQDQRTTAAQTESSRMCMSGYNRTPKALSTRIGHPRGRDHPRGCAIAHRRAVRKQP
jgi:hypothetical protein